MSISSPDLNMNPEIFELYEKLVENVASLFHEEWKSFKLTCQIDDSGLGLGLEFITVRGEEMEVLAVPSTFRLISKIREESGPGTAWSEWIFEFNRNGKYSIRLKYPDSPAVSRD